MTNIPFITKSEGTGMTLSQISRLIAPTPRFGLVSRLRQLRAVARQRRALAALDVSRLRDLGLSAEDARIEAARPFWDVPATWRD